MLTEHEVRAVLRPRFAAAGVSLLPDFRLSEGGIDVVLDGFDPQRRVGYEFIARASGDPDQFSPAVLAALEARMRAGALHLLLLDEAVVPGVPFLERAADRFLVRLRELGRLP